MGQRHNNILGRQLPTRFFAIAKERVCFGNLDLGKLTGFPKGTCVRQGGLGNTLAPRKCERGHIHEGNALLDVVARKHRAKRALGLGVHAHHGHASQHGVIGVDIVVIHMDQDVARSRLSRNVSLFTDGALAIQGNLLCLRKVGHQILNLVVAIIHNNPLQFVGRIGLAQKGLLGQSKELTTVTSDRQNADLREVLFRGQERLNRLLGLQWQVHPFKSLNPLLMACFVLLANDLGCLGALAVSRLGLLPKLLDQAVDRGLGKDAQTFGMVLRLGNFGKQGVRREFAKGRQIGKNEVATTRHGFVHPMAEPFGGRRQDDQTTLVQERILLVGWKNFAVNLDLGGDLLGDRIGSDQLLIVHQVKLGKLLLQNVILLVNADIGLQNRLGMAPHVLADRNQCLVLIRKLRQDLINTGPTHVLHGAPPIGKERLGFMGLHPNLVQMLGQWLLVLVRPLGIGDPDVATSLGEEGGVQGFQKDVDFSFLALGIREWDLTKLDIVFPEDVRDNSHQKSCILHEPRATIDNEVHSHVLLQVAFCRPLSARRTTTGPRAGIQVDMASPPCFRADVGMVKSHLSIPPPHDVLPNGNLCLGSSVQLFGPLTR